MSKQHHQSQIPFIRKLQIASSLEVPNSLIFELELQGDGAPECRRVRFVVPLQDVEDIRNSLSKAIRDLSS